MLAAPAEYAGQQITVSGVLEFEGQMPQMRFFLRSARGRLLEVTPWLPLEVMHPPSGGTAPKTMASYVGLALCLTGTLEQGSTGFIVRVETAAEQP